MDAMDCGAPGVTGICKLEWLSWAIEAAHEHNVSKDSSGFHLDYAYLYADELIGI
jgi:hypothetical protein